MKYYYVDLIRGPQITYLAGPFVDEATARKYERAAVGKFVEQDPFAKFDDFGVTAISGGYQIPGLLNDQLAIDPADLLVGHRGRVQ